MKFITNTKPLVDAINLGVVNSNVSKYNSRTCTAQITANASELVINLESESVYTEIHLPGSGDENDQVVSFVSNTLLKSLVGTFESSTTTFEFVEGGVVLHSGKSRFTLPEISSEADMSLRKPDYANNLESSVFDVKKDNWSFIKNNQTFAISMSYVSPIYTYVWVGANGDVLTGDNDNGIFTHSMKNPLSSQCLVQESVVNFFDSLPEGAECTNCGDFYIVSIKTDGYQLYSEIVPIKEDDDHQYNSDIILGLFNKPDYHVTIDPNTAYKILSQAELLSSAVNSEDGRIHVKLENDLLSFRDSNVDASVKVAYNSDEKCNDFELDFYIKSIKSIVSKFTGESVNIAPTYLEGEVTGILIWDDDLECVLAGAE